MKKTETQNVLFVCTANQQRSPTAEKLYRDDPRFSVDSAGTEALFMSKRVTPERLEWADLVVVMEERHARTIRSRFSKEARKVRMVVLGIPDIFEYMDERLQREIRDRFEAAV